MPVERPRPLRRLLTVTIPTTRQRLLSAVLSSPDRILTLDPATRSLKTYHWFVRVAMLTFTRCQFDCLHRPVLGTERVPPDAWREHRESHHFLGPCCLCPLYERLGKKSHFKEAAIYMTLRGIYKGEYIAACVDDRCGYLGWSSFSLKIKFS